MLPVGSCSQSHSHSPPLSHSDPTLAELLTELLGGARDAQCCCCCCCCKVFPRCSRLLSLALVVSSSVAPAAAAALDSRLHHCCCCHTYCSDILTAAASCSESISYMKRAVGPEGSEGSSRPYQSVGRLWTASLEISILPQPPLSQIVDRRN